jgi:hypothetical protein
MGQTHDLPNVEGEAMNVTVQLFGGPRNGETRVLPEWRPAIQFHVIPKLSFKKPSEAEVDLTAHYDVVTYKARPGEFQEPLPFDYEERTKPC